jgi:hypothetical protein
MLNAESCNLFEHTVFFLRIERLHPKTVANISREELHPELRNGFKSCETSLEVGG